jgi:hypothetical protein
MLKSKYISLNVEFDIYLFFKILYFFAYTKTHVHLSCFQSSSLSVFLGFSFISFVFLCYSI